MPEYVELIILVVLTGVPLFAAVIQSYRKVIKITGEKWYNPYDLERRNLETSIILCKFGYMPAPSSLILNGLNTYKETGSVSEVLSSVFIVSLFVIPIAIICRVIEKRICRKYIEKHGK